MALPPDYEHIRASLLHRHPLSTVGQALAELRSEETHKKTIVYQHCQPVLATPVWAPLPPPSQRDTHSYEDCRSRPKSKRKGYHNRQTAAVTDSSGPSPDSSSSTLTIVDVESIVTQVLSCTNIHSSVLSTTSADGSLMTTTHTGTISTPDLTIDHTYLDPRTEKTIRTGRKVGRLFELESLYAPHRSVAAASSSSSHVSFGLWHSRLGHASVSKLQKLISRGYLGSVKTESNFHCLACQTGKQHALPFQNSDSIASAPFDLIHSDV
ncbi:hypothetical protein Acr_11g0009850 [Actinidia rufa]|uniref:GAG-pre-integrase domain-containing protein n=1 Tax=Actinidia rufa TaxID=165716 RepID=A0A7J0FES7_9ERIC|nr:hypothetical protein Acr_11g0009850 [Actinidia rufa]